MEANRKGAYSCSLSENLLQRAKNELNECPDTRHLEIKTLRKRLMDVPGFRGRVDDEFLLRFLRCKKFDQENAFNQVMTYYTMRKNNPDIYENLTPRRVINVLDEGVIGVLNNRAPDGSKVIVFKPGKHDPERGKMTDVLAANFLSISKLIEDSFPGRFKAVYWVNEPAIFDAIFSVMKLFMKEKLLNRVHMFGRNFSELHEKLPANILPEDYGGSLPTYSSAEWKQLLLDNEDHFKAENKFGLLDMTLPTIGNSNRDANESLPGTFRKLNV